MMNKPIKKGKEPLKHKDNLIDSVSATELLQALHTLEHISVVQEQLEEDLNISFSQNDNFNNTDQHIHNHHQQQSSVHTPSKKNMSKNPINKNHQQNQDQNSKMDFEFYMTQKQNKYKNKSSYQIINKNNQQKITQKSITPRKKITQNKINTHNKSLSPLTQRSMNTSNIPKPNNSTIPNNQSKVKTQTFTPTKLLSKIPLKNENSQVKEQKMLTNRNKQNLIQIKVNYPNQKDIKKRKPSSSILQLSIHERNKEFLKQKNEKLAKLSQEIEEKKKQQQKQCTFKPKIISDNSHIKSKYNDLCASRQFYEKTHRRCKTGKQNMENCFQEDVELKTNFSRQNKFGTTQFSQGFQQGLELEQTAKLSMEQCDSRVKGPLSVHPKDEANKSMVKKKYKNSKFNILLDLIH